MKWLPWPPKKVGLGLMAIIFLIIAVFLFYIATSKEPEHRPAPAAPQKISGPTLPA
jgi:hypothetical protein